MSEPHRSAFERPDTVPATFQPESAMLYFAYGSNMDPEQMKSRCPEHAVVGLASLQDYQVAFPRYSNEWGGGTASIQLAHGKTVWGALYELTDADLERLDRVEGFVGTENQHNVHDRETVTLELTRPDDGSIPRRVRAWTYVARPARATPPSARYMEHMIAGARHHRFPEDYIATLMQIEVATPAEAAGETPESDPDQPSRSASSRS